MEFSTLNLIPEERDKFIGWSISNTCFACKGDLGNDKKIVLNFFKNHTCISNELVNEEAKKIASFNTFPRKTLIRIIYRL